MIQLFKAKSLKKTRESLTSNVEEKTREKAILKEGIGTNREAFVSRRGRTRASLFGTYTPSKMGFAVQSTKGRSMVEMLGVLAIIGVLSIGGISGYTIAMRKYRVNEILNLVNKYAMVVYSNCLQSIEKDPEKYGIIKPAYPSSYYFDDETANYWYCKGINFTDSGLGNLPSGVYEIGGSGTVNEKSLSVTIKSTSSGDAVVVMVYFDSKELCETALNTVGMDSVNAIGHGKQTCSNTSISHYPLAITVMMN